MMKKLLGLLFLLLTLHVLHAQEATKNLVLYDILCCHLKNYADTSGLVAVSDSAVILDIDGESDGSIYFKKQVRIIESSLIGNALYIKEKGRQRYRMEFASHTLKGAFKRELRGKKYVRIRNYKWIEYPVYTLSAGILALVLMSPFITE